MLNGHFERTLAPKKTARTAKEKHFASAKKETPGAGK
jgi:hypothetical protein